MKRKMIALFLALAMIITLTPSLGIVHADDESPEMVVTNVISGKPAYQWNEYIDITIEYQAPAEPDEVLLEFDLPANPVYHPTLRLSEDFMLKSDYSFIDYTELKSHTFDPVTCKGSISYRRKIDISFRAGTYRLYSMTCPSYDNGYWTYNEYRIPDDLPGFDIATPCGTPVFDKEHFRTDLISSLESLNDGDVAVVRCDNSLTDAIYDEETGELSGYRWYLLKKEYLDAIKGRDVTVVFPVTGCIAVINGKDITGDTKDVDFGGGMGMSFSVNPDGSSYFYAYFEYPDNGILPCSFKYMYDYESALRSFLDASEEVRLTKNTFDDHIDNAALYCYSGGLFVPEGEGFSRDDLWIWFNLDHNSSFIGTDSDPKALRSFKASLGSTKLTYNGKVQKPKLYVRSDLRLPYTVKYSNKSSKSIGTYKITVTGTKGGFGKRVLTYQIVPKGTSLSSVKAAKRGFTVRLKKQSSLTKGYQIQYATNSKFTANVKTVKVKSTKTLSRKFSGLKGGKKYYVRVRTYTVRNGVTISSKWSKYRSVTTKK